MNRRKSLKKTKLLQKCSKSEEIKTSIMLEKFYSEKVAFYNEKCYKNKSDKFQLVSNFDKVCANDYNDDNNHGIIKLHTNDELNQSY